VGDYPGGEKGARDAALDMPCETWIPAARPDVIRADKVRRNTERMLEAARAGNLLPRAAAVALAEHRLRKAMALRRWS
jgi:glutamate dehydrogenase/leucine dehydrogenase